MLKIRPLEIFLVHLINYVRNDQSVQTEIVKEGEEKAIYFMSRFILTGRKLSSGNDSVLDHN